MNGKKRLIVLLLTVAMVLSQMSLVAFADNEAAGEADQTVTEQAVEETQPEEVAFDQTVTVDGVDITVKAAKGVFPAGAELSATGVDLPDAIDSDNALAFDIKILVDGEEVQPKDNAKVEVSFKAAEVKKFDTEVYHMDGDDPEKLDVEEKGSTATVETTGFSTYVLVFTVVGGTEESYSYTMGDDQKVLLSELISGSGYDPKAGTDYYQSGNVTYEYANATSSDTTKLDFKEEAGTGWYAYVPNDATFNDGERLTVKIPWSYKYRETEGSGAKTAKGEAVINVSVTSVDSNIVAPTGYDDLVFNGQEQALLKTPGSSTVAGVTFEYKVDDDGSWYQFAGVGPQATEAGNHTVYWRAMGNNGAVDSGEVEVNIAEIFVEAPVAAEGLVYNDEDQILIAEEASTNADGVSIFYAVTAVNETPEKSDWKSDYRDDDLKQVDAGDYWVWYTVAYKNGSSWVKITEPAHIDASIDKAECPVEVETVGTLPYTGQAQDLVRVLNNEEPNFTVSYSVNDGDWVTNLPQGTEPGDYSIRWKIAETGNYYGASSEEPVVTTIAEFTFTEPVADDSLVYNGRAQQLIKEPASLDLDIPGLSIEYARTAVNADAPGFGWTEDYEDLTRTDAGDYWIWYRARYGNPGARIYIVQPDHITATIKKADCPVEVETVGTLEYTGSTQRLVRELNNPTGQGRFTIQYSINDGNWVNGTSGAANVTGTEVGSYSIRWKFEGNNNYNPASGTVNTYIVEVDRMYGKATYTDENESGVWVYDGEKHGATVEAYVMNSFGVESRVSGAKVYYSLGTLLTADNYNTVGTTSPRSIYPRDAGNYTIYYYIVANDYEPFAGSVDVTINKAYLRISVVDKKTEYGTFVKYNKIKYSEAEQDGYIKVEAFKDADYQTEWNYVEGSITNINQFRFDTDGYTNYMSDAGTYYITVEDNLDSDNYIISYVSGKLTVTKKPLKFIWSNPQEWDYDGQPHRIDAHIDTKCLVGSDADDESLVTFKYTSDQVGIYTNEATNVLRVKDKDDPTKDWEVGDYIARIEEIRGSRASNYTIYVLDEKTGAETDTRVESAQETFRINPVDLTLTPNDVTTTFGDVAKDNGYTATGLVNNEKAEDVVIGTPVYEFVDYVPGTDVGKYDIKITNVEDPNVTKSLHAQNYTVKTEPNVKGHEVVQRKITLIWSTPKTFEYDGQYHGVKVDSVDNDYADKSAIGPEEFKPTYVDAEKIDADKYTAKVTLAPERAKNYEILNNSDEYEWEITKRPATIYVNSNTISYGQDPADKGYYIDDEKLVEKRADGKGPDSLGDVTLNINYRKNGRPGTYTIDAAVKHLNPNYYIAGIKKGTLTVQDNVTELVAQGKTKGKKAAVLSWNVVTKAASYDIYWSKCNTSKKKYKPKKIATVRKTTYKVKKLKKGVAYKFYVVAKDASGKQIAKSEMGHFITGNVMGKYTNPKKIKTSVKSLTLATGSSAQVTTTIKKVKKGKKLLNGAHTQKLRYFSANPAVASVAQNGIITAASPGWCRVYALATDGMWSVIEVNVK